VVGFLWRIASVSYQLNHLSASTIASISGVSRSPFGFGSDTSLSTLHLPGYPEKRKTRYPVTLAAPSGAGLSPARQVRLFTELQTSNQIIHLPQLTALYSFRYRIGNHQKFLL
jgi:hypothetical protein